MQLVLRPKAGPDGQIWTVFADHPDGTPFDLSTYPPGCIVIPWADGFDGPRGGASLAPTLAGPSLALAVKAECKTRILAKVSASAQTNVSDALSMMLTDAATGTPLTDAQKSDLALIKGIKGWIAEMQAACRALSAGPPDATYSFVRDEKWPAWDPQGAGWTALVARY